VRREVLYNILIELGVPMKLVRLIKKCLNEMYSRIHIGKNLSNNFPIQNGLKQGDSLSPLLFKFALEYAIRKFQEVQVGLKLNGMAYADDVNPLGGNIETIMNADTLIDASKEVCLEVNVKKTRQNLDIKLANRSFEILHNKLIWEQQ
jgi:hypothetical protein